MYKDFNKYEVYSDGRIFSYKSNKFLKPETTKNGYQQVCLTDNYGKRKMYSVHRVVYEAVTGEPIPKGYEINHRSECKTDNSFDNLELLSHKDNVNYGSGIERSSKTRINGKRSKQVGAFQNDKLVMTFPSTMEAQRNGFSQSAVSRCCNGKLPHYKGYEWRYLYIKKEALKNASFN